MVDPTAAIKAIPAILGPITRIISGCGTTCRQASAYADQAEAALRALRDNYLAAPSQEVRARTLIEMDRIMQWLDRGCRSVGGAAGQRCIAERLVRGGSAPWCPTGTGCDWYTLYYDPVANGGGVVGGGAYVPPVGGVDVPTPPGGWGNPGGGGGGGSTLLWVAVAVAAVLVFRRKR